MKPWRTPCIFADLHIFEELQCGHGGEAVENPMSRSVAYATKVLQCGHGGEAVENLSTNFMPGTNQRCFNAATAVKPWRTLRDEGPRRRLHRGFNAATAVKPWRTELAVVKGERYLWASMRPRR